MLDDPLEQAALAALGSVRGWEECIAAPAWSECPGVVDAVIAAFSRLVGLRVQRYGPVGMNPGALDAVRLKKLETAEERVRLERRRRREDTRQANRDRVRSERAKEAKGREKQVKYELIRKVWARMEREDQSPAYKRFELYWDAANGVCPSERTIRTALAE
jgi:hypothetical protein